MKIANVDVFESAYMANFRALAANHGVFIGYDKDRAALDIGLHFTRKADNGDIIVSNVVAWFQMKGILAGTLNEDQLKAQKSVQIRLERRQLLFWKFLQHSVYLAVYVQSVDTFFVIDIKKWMEANTDHMQGTTQTVAVEVPLTNALSDAMFEAIFNTITRQILSNTLDGNDQHARLIVRDDQVIRWLRNHTAEGKEVRARLIKYGSKMRSEMNFEERPIGSQQWTLVREHWQFAMGELDQSVPYIDFAPYEEDDAVVFVDKIYYDDEDGYEDHNAGWYSANYEEEYDPEPVDPDTIFTLPNGTSMQGAGAFEMTEFVMRVELNDVGIELCDLIDALVAAEVMTISKKTYFVSVAPFHKNDWKYI